MEDKKNDGISVSYAIKKTCIISLPCCVILSVILFIAGVPGNDIISRHIPAILLGAALPLGVVFIMAGIGKTVKILEEKKEKRNKK